MEYCAHCGKRTENVYNDFMVTFCAECNRIKPHQSVVLPFKCLMCGSMQDERYIGQQICDKCEEQPE